MKFNRSLYIVVPVILLTVLALALPPSAHASATAPARALVSFAAPPAQGPGDALGGIGRLVGAGQAILDILQGKAPAGEGLISQLRAGVHDLLDRGGAGLFFLDFSDPNIRLNQFAADVARTLLMLTPLYVFGYLAFLVFSVWRERPVPNPLLYAALVLGVMIFLAAFAVITQGMSQVGGAVSAALSGSNGTLLDSIDRALAALQQNGGILSVLALLVAIAEGLVILVQLAYRGLSMAIWRLLGVLLIPFSVLLEGTRPRTAGRVIAGFFEAWLDMAGKLTLLLIVLAVAASGALAGFVWLVLPAGLLIVVFSWKYLGLLYVMLRDAVGRAWGEMVPAPAEEPAASMPAANEAALARQVDEERRRLLDPY